MPGVGRGNGGVSASSGIESASQTLIRKVNPIKRQEDFMALFLRNFCHQKLDKQKVNS